MRILIQIPLRGFEQFELTRDIATPTERGLCFNLVCQYLFHHNKLHMFAYHYILDESVCLTLVKKRVLFLLYGDDFISCFKKRKNLPCYMGVIFHYVLFILVLKIYFVLLIWISCPTFQEDKQLKWELFITEQIDYRIIVTWIL